MGGSSVNPSDGQYASSICDLLRCGLCVELASSSVSVKRHQPVVLGRPAPVPPFLPIPAPLNHHVPRVVVYTPAYLTVKTPSAARRR